MNMADESFIDIMRETKLPADELDSVLSNPEGLTREGVEYHLGQWKNSNNKYVVKKYDEMLKRCKNLESSGKTTDGKTILARIDGKVTWAQ
tara:strand:- start:92 stop:364 length:273 start_codon:yes stop_codon:yes gene_type:complete